MERHVRSQIKKARSQSKTNRRELPTDPVPCAGHSQKQGGDPRRHKGRHLERNHPSHGHSDLQQDSEPLSFRPESEGNVQRALPSPLSSPRSLAIRSPRGPSHPSCTVPEAFPNFRCRRYRIPVDDGQGNFSTSISRRCSGRKATNEDGVSRVSTEILNLQRQRPGQLRERFRAGERDGLVSAS